MLIVILFLMVWQPGSWPGAGMAGEGLYRRRIELRADGNRVTGELHDVLTCR